MEHRGAHHGLPHWSRMVWEKVEIILFHGDVIPHVRCDRVLPESFQASNHDAAVPAQVRPNPGEASRRPKALYLAEADARRCGILIVL